MKKMFFLALILIYSCNITNDKTHPKDLELINTIKNNIWCGVSYGAADGFSFYYLEFGNNTKEVKFAINSFNGDEISSYEMKINNGLIQILNKDTNKFDNFVRISRFTQDELEVYFFKDGIELEKSTTLFRQLTDSSIIELLKKNSSWSISGLNAYETYYLFSGYNTYFTDMYNTIYSDIYLGSQDNSDINTETATLEDLLDSTAGELNINEDSIYLTDYSYSIDLQFNFTSMSLDISIKKDNNEIYTVTPSFVIKDRSIIIYSNDSTLYKLGRILNISSEKFYLENIRGYTFLSK